MLIALIKLRPSHKNGFIYSYYRLFSVVFIIACVNCNTNGTFDEICDMVSGICLCKDNIVGKNCTECRDGMYGAPDQLIECQACPCGDNIDDPVCHLNTSDLGAICECGPAYDGRYCEECANGYYRDQV